MYSNVSKHTAKDLTDDQIEEYKEAFSLFTKNGSGTVSAKDTGTLMRSVGYLITDSELMDMLIKLHIDINGTIDLNNFLSLMSQVASESDNEEELRAAFRAFDVGGKGFIPAAALRHIMTKLGDKLPEDEVDEMMREANIDSDGQIDYEEFVTMMMTM